MKKAFIPLAVIAIALASCDTDVKDSYSKDSYTEYNLIVDTQDINQPAWASVGKYEVKINYSHNQIDVKASDITINNQNYSFETEPAPINVSYGPSDNETQVNKVSFTAPNTSSSIATNVKGAFVYWKAPTTDPRLNPSFTMGYSTHLDMNYKISDRYQVQTFFPNALYTGNSSVTEGANTYSTKTPTYVVLINFEKNLADIYISNPEYAPEMPKDYPQQICLTEIPVLFNHTSYYLESASPKTTVLGKNDKDQITLVESDDFKVKDFSLKLISSDLTDADISYTLGDREYRFRGSSVYK